MKTSKTVKAAVLIAAAVFTAGSPLAMFSGAFSAPSIIAYADDYQKDGLTFELFDDHAEVSGSDYTATSADIPASVEGLPVTAIKDYAFNGSAIESVKIPDSVKTIGNWTFSMCTNLKAVTLPDSIEYIGIKAFELCSSLSEVEFPDHLVEISNHVFADTPWLKAQQEKNDLVIINGALIDADKSKGDVVIPSDVKYISAGAFQRNENITSVVVPSGVSVINDSTFFYCKNLKSATLPNVKSIGIMAFDGCESLSELKLSGKLETISDYAFSDIPGSATITFYGSKDAWEKVTKPENDEFLSKAKMIFDESAQPDVDEEVAGDVNMDGQFNVSDLVAFQKWLLADPTAELKNWKAADMCNDKILDVFDLCAMRKALTK